MILKIKLFSTLATAGGGFICFARRNPGVCYNGKIVVILPLAVVFCGRSITNFKNYRCAVASARCYRVVIAPTHFWI